MFGINVNKTLWIIKFMPVTRQARYRMVPGSIWLLPPEKCKNKCTTLITTNSKQETGVELITETPDMWHTSENGQRLILTALLLISPDYFLLQANGKDVFVSCRHDLNVCSCRKCKHTNTCTLCIHKLQISVVDWVKVSISSPDCFYLRWKNRWRPLVERLCVSQDRIGQGSEDKESLLILGIKARSSS